jgi:broad specificity phosphatase PhoE
MGSYVTEADDCLTQYGRQQAERLGNDWKDVHIDFLEASTLQRAHDTALQIAKYNHDATLKVTTKDIYVERRMGQAGIDAVRAGNQERAKALYTGLLPGQSGTTPRNHQPPGGGESPYAVANRARLSLIALIRKYGKELDEPPKEFLDKMVTNSPDVLPEGIPHVVVVSHNIFLAELYESMFGWNSDHRMTTCNYRNADW